MNIVNPYINTELSTTIGLLPDQMNNEYYLALKDNLIEKIQGKCYYDYGYIDKIYQITYHDSGLINGENLHGAAKFNIDFTARLCRPLIKTNIICKIQNINNKTIILINGPIKVYIQDGHYNKEKFFTDNNNHLRYKVNDGGDILEIDTYIIVTILGMKFSHRDKDIIALGYLQDIATDVQVKKYYDVDDEDDDILDIKEYLES